jgi:hypothetical protein
MVFLICSLITYTIGTTGVETTAKGTDLHNVMAAISLLSVAAALLFLVLHECARRQFHTAQLGWAIVPPLTVGFLAFVPFLWLALGRRRVRDWVVLAVYLAASVMAIIDLSSTPANASTTGLPAVPQLLLLVVAPVHTMLAFSPAARPPTWRDVLPAWASQRVQSLMDAAPPEGHNQAPDGPLEPPLTDSGEPAPN